MQARLKNWFQCYNYLFLNMIDYFQINFSGFITGFNILILFYSKIFLVSAQRHREQQISEKQYLNSSAWSCSSFTAMSRRGRCQDMDICQKSTRFVTLLTVLQGVPLCLSPEFMKSFHNYRVSQMLRLWASHQ